jgi:hypothetical protein
LLFASPADVVGQADASTYLAELSKNYQGELTAVTSQRFRDAIKAHNAHLLTYRQLIAIQGLQSMRPAGS